MGKENSILDQAAKFIRDRRNNHRWLSIVLCLAIVVTVGTFYVLIRQGHAMIHKDQVLDCQVQIHVHDDSCYDAENNLVCQYADYVVHMHNEDCYDSNGVLVCQLPEIEAHTHDDTCYHREQVLVCGLEETENHVHTEECYTKERGDLICGLEEHVHDASCYSVPETPAVPEVPATEGAEGEAAVAEAPAPAEPQLICGKEEHQHTDDCYTWNETLICPLEEGAGHVHDESCYQTTETMICGKEEHILHTHDDSCRDENGNLICGMVELNEHMHTADCFRTIELTGDEVAGLNPETTEVAEVTEATEVTESTEALVHVHDDSCYDEEDNLICGLEGHEHDDNCYDEEGNLICEYAPEEAPVHVHGEECYDEEGNLICELEGHEHDDSCYDEEGNLICEYAPEEEPEHVHSDRCYDRDGKLICGYEEHVHDDSCYDEEGNLICKHVTERSHEHDVNCYDENGELICGYEEARDHEHDKRCYDENGELICGYEGMKDHVHSEECYDEEGNLICGYEIDEEETAYTYVKTFEAENFIITAMYNEDANIPEEAELIAEQITAESDEEHYAQREAEYQETVADENASMRALLKVGFYVDGAEVEPESPVMLTVQFLGEDGLADGSPITVIHFADEGTEVLDGGTAENNSTTFEMGSFSEIAIGYVSEGEEKEKKPLHISEAFQYSNDAFQITFYIDGEAKTVDGEPLFDESEDEDGDSEETDGVAGEEGSAGDTGADEAESGDFSESDEIISDEEEASGDAEVSDEIEGGADDAMNSGSDAVKAEPVILSEEGEGESEAGFGFKVEVLDESSEKYTAVASFINDNDASNMFLTDVISYKMTYEENELDLSDCQVSAKIVPTDALKEYTTDSAMGAAVYADEAETAGGTDSSEEMKIVVTAYSVSEADKVEEVGNMVVGASSYEEEMLFDMADDTLGMYALLQYDPKFTVQYYAYLKVMADTKPEGEAGKTFEGIELIDTSKNGDGSGGTLPTNGTNPRLTYIYAGGTSKTKGTWFDIVYEESLEMLYTESRYQFLSHPKLDNFNKFRVGETDKITDSESDVVNNNHYQLSEIWVLKEGRDSASKDRADWDIYGGDATNVETIEFTNNPNAEGLGPNMILIKEGTVVRLVAKSNSDGFNNPVAFYDYDITDGKVYSDKNNTETTRNPNANQYGYTVRNGINSAENYSDTGGILLGVGNANTQTGLGGQTLNGYYINRSNTNVYGKCSFGIVQSQLVNGRLQYSGGIQAPDLFGEGETSCKGSTAIPGHELMFERVGDTYTLTSVGGTNATGLDKIMYNGKAWADGIPEEQRRDMWVNQFWPMDAATTWGVDGHDLKFGSAALKEKRGLKGDGSGQDKFFPVSDDEQDHNSYFGMNFSVSFTLTADYVGPLNYYFFGDDDMWVFLDNQLICDIGGVHQAAGEYVDLWDWIKKGDTGEHTLRFFYTERGASGSTCWMQFTLPSVRSNPVEYPSGECKNTLKVTKNISGVEINQAFEFVINFQHSKEDKEPLPNIYSYDIYEDGKAQPIESGGIKDGDTFKLKSGQYIIVKGLPDGSSYTITEKNAQDYNYLPEINNVITANGMVEGEIEWTRDDEVGYVNVYAYELPETGGSGTTPYTVAGVLCILSGAGLTYRKKFRERKFKKAS